MDRIEPVLMRKDMNSDIDHLTVVIDQNQSQNDHGPLSSSLWEQYQSGHFLRKV